VVSCQTKPWVEMLEKLSLFPRKRFKLSNEDNNAWELPDGMLKYVEQHFEEYIKEKKVKEEILVKYPIPNYMKKVKKLDEFFQELMKEKKKKVELELETTLEKIQQKLNDMLGPLAKLWVAMDQQVSHGCFER